MASHGHELPSPGESALLRAAAKGDAQIYAAFGGQGNTEQYFEELRTLFDSCGQRVRQLLDDADGLLHGLCQDRAAQKCFAQQTIELSGWLHSPSKTPESSVLISAPFSFPLIGILTLARYAVLCERLGQKPGQLRSRLAGATGHSQGILAATAIALADSWEDFFAAAKDMVVILFWIGVRCQDCFGHGQPPAAAIDASLQNEEGVPTPMLSVNGLSLPALQGHIDIVNSHLHEDHRLSISLVNGRDHAVVSGPPQSLCGLNARLRLFNAPQNLDQSRIPFDKRKLTFSRAFLPISAPFHSKHLRDAYDDIVRDVSSIVIAPKSLGLPLYATNSGENLQLSPEPNLVRGLIRMIVSDKVDWPKAVDFPRATHVIDFGPGGSSGVGALIHNIKQGLGLRVVLATDAKARDSRFGNVSEVLDSNAANVRYSPAWADFGPRLIRDSTGRLHLDTKLSRLLALPPIMVAGMTPTTVHWDVVAAIMNAGYHAELAGGGYLHAEEMEQAIHRILDAAPPGRGVTCNLIYASPRAMAWQIPLIRSLTAKGVNVEGLTIGAGVPSPDVANEYIRTLGLKHISFKPGSAQAISQVVEIAKQNPTFPIILQWTGGRGGGHHSAEDLHQPILQTYQSIRLCKNLCLVAGSGFGGADDTFPYLTGTWSLQFGLPPMPFDGLLLGSRMMTAKESHTCTAAKQAIVDAVGVPDADWTQTYSAKVGDVLSVVSEMGQPIHKLATRGTRLWAELDRSIFSLDRSKRSAQLRKDRARIMDKLDKDFQKPWFGKTARGMLVDLEDMTYVDVLRRLIRLTYISHTSVPRWADESWKQLTRDWIQRIEERFSRSRAKELSFDASKALDQPLTVADKLSEGYPSCTTELMKTQDVSYFLSICGRRGQKPVPFVPRLDDDFETWFKKDSLWQSEDIDAVVDQDVGRVCILQGPVAVEYSRTADEPVKSILDAITNQHTDWLVRDKYSGSLQEVPAVAYFSNFSRDGLAGKAEIVSPGLPDREVFEIASSPDEVVDSQPWFQALGGSTLSWRQAAFGLEHLVGGKYRYANPIRTAFRPRPGIRVICSNIDTPSLTVVSLQETRGPSPVEKAKLELAKDGSLRMSLRAIGRNSTAATLPFSFTYHPESGYSVLREVMNDRTQRVQQFYYRLWFDEELPSSREGLTDVFDGGEVTLDREMLQSFQGAIGNRGPLRKGSSVPMDLGILVAWKALMRPLFHEQIGGDILKMVHLSNSFRSLPGADPLREGDTVRSTSKITKVRNNATGMLVEVRATIHRVDTPVLEIVSEFQYRNTYADAAHTFERRTEVALQLYIEDAHTLNVLSSKKWFHRKNPDLDLVGTVLAFDLETYGQVAAGSAWRRLEVGGSVRAITSSGEQIDIGSVFYQSEDARGNIVLDFLTRTAKPVESSRPLPNPVALHDPESLTIVAPASNSAYSEASGDRNPIHMSEIFSGLAGLPGTITHGMYTSAVVRGVLEERVAESHLERFRSFKCSFVGMVLPGDELLLTAEHTAMAAGRKVVRVSAMNKSTNAKVLQGEAEIDQPTTSYVFTGQGSQEKGMGMDLYESSPVAKMIWDSADKHLMEAFGTSLSSSACAISSTVVLTCMVSPRLVDH